MHKTAHGKEKKNNRQTFTKIGNDARKYLTRIEKEMRKVISECQKIFLN